MQHNDNNIDRGDEQNFDPYIFRSGYFDSTYAPKKALDRPSLKSRFDKIKTPSIRFEDENFGKNGNTTFLVTFPMTIVNF